MADATPLDLDEIVAAIRALQPDTRAIYMHGSQATGDARPDSDVDLAVLIRSPLSLRDRIDLATVASRAAGREADIMDLARASPIAQFEVMDHGRLLYDGDPRATAEFELEMLREYHELRRLRSPLVADMIERLAADA